MEISRGDSGKHLESCPASVVMCMAEWNRWPLFSSEKLRSIPFRQRNPFASEGQLGKPSRVFAIFSSFFVNVHFAVSLDYDLTLRDERMLNGLGQISRKTKLSLRNNLTRRFPDVPLPNESFNKEFDFTPKGGGLPPELLLDTGEDLTFLGEDYISYLSYISYR